MVRQHLRVYQGTERRLNIYHERNKQFEQKAPFKYKISRHTLRYDGIKPERGHHGLGLLSWRASGLSDASSYALKEATHIHHHYLPSIEAMSAGR
ncbi:hypothetical protein JTE90_025186 [Oedothorax gibbosus]|uniref:Uncharacterized protein n=1 Tax=Oedothorax gibbosus TaxID=931172 RepID=A0AAV6UBX1_9ARAC|nr:hypothetical protein JTE90_025186 [Oedothorax gibbosus]